jgi:hypothetical protein
VHLPLARPTNSTNTISVGHLCTAKCLADLNADARAYLESQDASLTMHNIQLGYDYWDAGSLDASPRECFSYVVVTLDEILHAILPEELLDGSPTGFSAMGHLGRPPVTLWTSAVWLDYYRVM